MEITVKQNKLFFDEKDMSELFELKEVNIDPETNEGFIVAGAKATIQDMKIDGTLGLMLDEYSESDLNTLRHEIDFELEGRKGND